MKTKIISFANHKGGVGKTTTTASVGSILSSTFRKKVLLIDLDAQANLTSSLFSGEIDQSIYHALTGKSVLPIVGINENMDLVPASLQLAMVDLELGSAISRERLLQDLIEPIKEKYDYILIDCPPSLSLLTLNAFTASNEIIIPLTAEILPFKGLKMISDFIEMVKKRLNPNAHISGILITRWENTKLSRQIEEGLRNNSSLKTFETRIRKNVSLAEAPLESKNVVDYAPKSNGAYDYCKLTEEIVSYLE